MSRRRPEEEQDDVEESSSGEEESDEEEEDLEEAKNQPRKRGRVEIKKGFTDLCSSFRRTLRYQGQGSSSSSYKEWMEEVKKLYGNSPLPTAKQIAPHVKDDMIFLKIYQELYFRHIYENLVPTVTDRFESFMAFLELFDLIIAFRTDKPELDLNTLWLSDIMHVFISNFREFHEFRHNLHKYSVSSHEKKLLQKATHMWGVRTVVRYLHVMAKKGGADLSNLWVQGPVQPSSNKRNKNIADVFRYVSHFSLIALSRVHCLLGDYMSSVRVLDSIDLSNRKNQLNTAPIAKLSLYYHAGFSYLLLRRYLDCVKSVSPILGSRSRIFQDRAYQAYLPEIEKIWKLLALANKLSPQALDTDIQAQVKEKGKGSVEELFLACAPPFIDPSLPNFNLKPAPKPNDTIRPAFEAQKQIFMAECAQRNLLPQVYNDLKMCTNVKISKISELLEQQTSQSGEGSKSKVEAEKTLTILMKLKHKTRNLRWQVGSATSSGKWTSTGDVDFQVDRDVIIIKEPVNKGNLTEYFIRQIMYQQDHQITLRHS